jgi:hypothetical protein
LSKVEALILSEINDGDQEPMTIEGIFYNSKPNPQMRIGRIQANGFNINIGYGGPHAFRNLTR